MQEKTTVQTDNSSRLLQSELFQKIVMALGSRGIVFVLSLSISILVARTLGPEGRGLFGITTAISTLGVQLGLLGLHSSNTFHVAKKPKLLPIMISNSLLISLLLGIIVMGILFCFRHQILGYTSISHSLLALCFVLIPINICFSLLQGLLTGMHQFKSYNFSEIVNKALYALFILGCLGVGSLSVFSATLFQGIAFIVSILFMLKMLLKSCNHLEKPSLSLLKQNLFYGSKAYLACFFAWGIMRLDIFILQRFQNLEQVGYYSVALSIIDVFLMFSSVVSTILHPKLCSEPDLKKNWITTKNTALGSAVVILLGTFIVLLWKDPFRWMFGSPFLPSHQAMIYLLPGFVLLSLQTVLAQFIISRQYPWSLVLIWGGGLVLKLPISMILISLLGIKGIGISWFVIYLFVFVSVFINIKLILKNHKIKNRLENDVIKMTN